jgi:ketosteroid isomerase-like protein
VTEHPYAERIRSFYEAYANRGVEGAAYFLNDRFTWHVSGNNPLSGAYHGKEGYRELARRMSAMDASWQFDVDDVLVNDHLVMALVRLGGQRKDRRIYTEGAHLFRIGDDGRIAEAWGFVINQGALDELLS